MCGVFGLFNPDYTLFPDAAGVAEQMAHSLSHRGPDGHGIRDLWGGRCILGHTRLSIIDLQGGTQPLANEDRDIWVTFNGEIYNYLELRQELQSKGHRFQTASDTEVLVHLYEEYGVDLLDHLVGMFAFALLDQRQGLLFLARDRLGEKPLYYTQLRDGTWAFASELKALLLLPNLDRTPDWVGLAQYLALRFTPSPRTHLSGIKKLPPASYRRLGAMQDEVPQRYWRIDFNTLDRRRLPELLEALQDQLDQSVRIQLRSDVPLGAFLSGGVDSALVCASIARHIPASQLQTFCVGFDDAQLDESDLAAATAAAIGTNHHTLRLSSWELYRHLDELVRHYDEPLGDVSMLPTWVVCREARKHVKVILSGDGGDESFGGYRHYFAYLRFRALRNIPGIERLACLLHAPWQRLHLRGRGLLEFLATSDKGLLIAEKEWEFSRAVLGPLHNEAVVEAKAEWEGRLSPWFRMPYPTSAMRCDLLEGYLPEQILVKVDRASMFAGLESRAPFLDHRLVEFAIRIPAEQHFGCNLGKLIPRMALPKSIPDAVRWGAKRGFTPPWAAWIRGPLKLSVEQSIAQRPAHLLGVNTNVLETLLFQHCHGADHSDQLFRWFALTRSQGFAVPEQPGERCTVP